MRLPANGPRRLYSVSFARALSSDDLKLARSRSRHYHSKLVRKCDNSVFVICYGCPYFYVISLDVADKIEIYLQFYEGNIKL